MSASRKKGTSWETAIVQCLRENGVPHAERRAANGTKDRGDIAGLPGIVIECKAERQITLAAYVDEAETERRHDHARHAAVWIKRRGKASPADGYVVMTGSGFLQLLVDAGYIPPPPHPDSTASTSKGVSPAMAEQTNHIQAALDEIRDARAHSCDQCCIEGGCDFDLAGFVNRVDEILAGVALAAGSPHCAQVLADRDPMPVFTIKAKDRLALAAVRAYRHLCDDHGLQEQALEVDKAFAEMADWRQRNPEWVKDPDHPHVPVAVSVERPPDLHFGTPRPGLVRLADLDLRDQHGQRSPFSDLVRFTAGSGRHYQGERSDHCPGDNVAGHRHDIRCIRQDRQP